MGHSALKDCEILSVGRCSNPDWTDQEIKKWVSHASGKMTSNLTDSTTHIVLSAKAWNDQSAIIQEALERKQNGQSIHLVNQEWLVNTIEKKGRRSENSSKYSWEKAQKKALEDAERIKIKASGPRNTSGLMIQALMQSTDQFVDEDRNNHIEKQQRQEELARNEQEEKKKRKFESERSMMRIKEVAKFFSRKQSKYRNDLISDDHHIYVDEVGFTYNVSITRSNERLVLQIYESNSDLPTYAFNCSFASANLQEKRNIIGGYGSTLETALRIFKKIFKEKTHVAWQDRSTERSEKQNTLKSSDEEPFVYQETAVGGSFESVSGTDQDQNVDIDSHSAHEQSKNFADLPATQSTKVVVDTQDFTTDLIQQNGKSTYNIENAAGNPTDKKVQAQESDMVDSPRNNLTNSVLGKRRSTPGEVPTTEKKLKT